jgi:hypothetical protein
METQVRTKDPSKETEEVMPQKKKRSIIEEDIEQLESIEEKEAKAPQEELPHESVELVKACVNCRFINHGYSGPTCINPESPYPQQRVREDDVCEKHEFQP